MEATPKKVTIRATQDIFGWRKPGRSGLNIYRCLALCRDVPPGTMVTIINTDGRTVDHIFEPQL